MMGSLIVDAETTGTLDRDTMIRLAARVRAILEEANGSTD